MTLLVNKEEYQQRLHDNINDLISNHSIHGILPLSGINIDNNDKSSWGKALGQYGSCKCVPKISYCNKCKSWKNAICSQLELSQSIENNTTGFIIKTGKINDIFVIDWDNKPNPTEQSIAIRDECLKSKTLTITTPSGGYHFYYRYDKNITRGICGMYGNVDIRTDNNCCYFGIRKDGEYSPIKDETNVVIKNCPSKIATQVIKCIEEKQQANIKTSLITDKDEKFKVSTAEVESYFITDSILSNLLNLLIELQPEFLDDYSKWLSITIICKKINLPERSIKTSYTKSLNAKRIWDEWSKQSSKYNYTNNRNIWDCIDLNKKDENGRRIYTYNLNYIVKTINTKMEEDFKAEMKKKSKNKHYNGKYKDVLEPKCFKLPVFERIYFPYEKINNLKQPTIINQKYLDDTAIAKQDISLIESGLGTGKTRVVNTHIINNNKCACSLVHLISLCDNQIASYNSQLVDNKVNTDNNKMIKYQDIKLYETTNSVNTTINSLLKVNQAIKDKTGKSIEEHFDTIFIDEAHRIIHNIFSNPTLKKDRRKIVELILSIIKNAKQVVLTDGDFDTLTGEFFKITKRKYKYTKNKYKSFDKVPVRFEDNIDIVYLDMYNNVKKKIFFTCACNTAKMANSLKERLLSWGVPEKDILLYTADTYKNIGNASIEWDNKYVIYSPKITEGVDRTSITAEIVYQFIISEATINVIQLKQQLCRNRNIKKVIIYLEALRNECNHSTYDQFKEDKYSLRRICNDPIYDNLDISSYDELLDRKYDEEKSIFVEQENVVSKLFITSKWIDYTLRVNMKSSLYDILTELGFEIQYDPVDNLKNCINQQIEFNKVVADRYTFSVSKYIPETDDNGCVNPKDIIHIKNLNFHSWLDMDNRIIYEDDTDKQLKEIIQLVIDNKEDQITDDNLIKNIVRPIKTLPQYDKELIFDKFVNWRSTGGIISDKVLTTDYNNTPFLYNRGFITENHIDIVDSNITALTNKFYIKLGFERLLLNKNEERYNVYTNKFNQLKTIYNKREDVYEYIKKVNGEMGITNYTKIDRDTTKKIRNFDYKIIDKLIKINKIPLEDEEGLEKEDLRLLYHTTYSKDIEKIFTDKIAYSWYENVRYYICDNKILLDIVKKGNRENNKIINAGSNVLFIYEFKCLFRKYFPEICLFTLEHTDKGKYQNEKANVDSKDITDKFIPLLKETNSKCNYKFNTKDDLLKIFRILISYIFKGHFIGSTQKSIRVDGKCVKQNVYSITRHFNSMLRLILMAVDLGNSLDNDLVELYKLQNYKTISGGFINDSDSDIEDD